MGAEDINIFKNFFNIFWPHTIGQLLVAITFWISNFRFFHSTLLSNLQLIEFGVPQGSILGPLLFLLYINDLPNSSSILHYILFTDDSNVFLSHASYNQLIELVNLEQGSASDWFKANKLSLNLSKTNYIIFRSNKKQIPNNNNELIIDNINIPKSPHQNSLESI